MKVDVFSDEAMPTKDELKSGERSTAGMLGLLAAARSIAEELVGGGEARIRMDDEGSLMVTIATEDQASVRVIRCEPEYVDDSLDQVVRVSVVDLVGEDDLVMVARAIGAARPEMVQPAPAAPVVEDTADDDVDEDDDDDAE